MTFDKEGARARCEKATDGPWYISAYMPGTVWAGEFFVSATEPVTWDEDMEDEPVHGVLQTVNELSNAEANAEFCAHARTDLPAALDEIERLEEENERLRGLLREFEWTVRTHDMCFRKGSRAQLLAERALAALGEAGHE